MRTIVVAGGLGYIGSVLIRDLAAGSDSPLRVRVLDNMSREGYDALFSVADVDGVEFLEADILDPRAVRKALDGADTVVHLAALVSTPFSFDHPAWTEQVNHWGTARLVEQCIEAGVSRFILASSASIYGSGGPFREEDTPKPLGPYSQSKVGAEAAVRSAMDRGIAGTIVRLGTVFGLAPSMRFNAVVNRMAYLAALRRPLVVNGTGHQRRPLIHVRDASSALKFCVDHPETAGAVLNAVWQSPSILEIVSAVARIVRDVPVRYTEQDALTHVSTEVNGTRMRGLGWRPEHDLAEGLSEIIARLGKVRGVGFGDFALS
ncbi:MAG: SDR family oxidoreductase [Gemmatimonadota bacterium]|nr:SDR family oxidoreductase [Gemmatimonadota bacterium]